MKDIKPLSQSPLDSTAARWSFANAKIHPSCRLDLKGLSMAVVKSVHDEDPVLRSPRLRLQKTWIGIGLPALETKMSIVKRNGEHIKLDLGDGGNRTFKSSRRMAWHLLHGS